MRLFPKSSLDVPSICFDDVIEFQKTVNAITMGEKPVGCSVPGPTTSFVLGAIRAPNVQGVKRLNLISNNAPEGENGLLGGEKNLAVRSYHKHCPSYSSPPGSISNFLAQQKFFGST